MHRVGQGEGADAFPAVGCQRLTAQDTGGEGVQHAVMLGILPIGLHLIGFAIRLFIGGFRKRSGSGAFSFLWGYSTVQAPLTRGLGFRRRQFFGQGAG